MSGLTTVACDNCPYWSRRTADNGHQAGECKRNPIGVVKAPDEWCGEHPDLVKIGKARTGRTVLAPPD